ncbi:MAG: Fur family transcriptional regulator [Phycisphaerales bacterium]
MSTHPSNSPPPRAAIETHGLRCTRQRELLYETLVEMRSHPTAEELFAAARLREPSLSLATVYNTLDAFTDAGLARRIPATNGTGPCRFDADTFDHVHLSLPDGSVIDSPDDISRQLLAAIPPHLLAELERQLSLRISGVSLHLAVRPIADASA